MTLACRFGFHEPVSFNANRMLSGMFLWALRLVPQPNGPVEPTRTGR